jgi:general nucleoside transport system permease protein
MGPFDVAWLTATVRLATPLLFAGTGEMVSERAGILNIGLEGMMLAGAFFSFLGTWLWHDLVLGILFGVFAGMVVAAIMALLTIQARANQIVVGVGLNLMALGITTYAYREIFTTRTEVHLNRPHALAIPLLSKIPVVGPVLFKQTLFVYVAFIGVAVAWFVLYRTTWGLAIRAAGEVPAAADTAGMSVSRIRWIGTLTAGGMAGLGGAFLSVGQLGLFVEGMSAGRGFLALAAVIFGGWNPLGVLGACLVFGAADALQVRLQAYAHIPREVWLVIGVISLAYVVWTRVGARPQARSWLGTALGIALLGVGVGLFAAAPKIHFPPQLWLSVPYLLALLALAGLVGRVRMPTSLAVAYRRGGEG